METVVPLTMPDYSEKSDIEYYLRVMNAALGIRPLTKKTPLLELAERVWEEE